MKKRGLLTLIMILLTLTTLTGQTKILLIGNGEYEDGRIADLPGAIRDIQRLAEVFETLEIADRDKIQIRKNMSSRSLKYTIKDFLEEETEERKILYYSGHGYTKKDVGKTETYLLPSDTIEKYREDFLVNINQLIKDGIASNKEGELIIILDSCYSGGILKEGTKGLDDFQTRPKALIEIIKGTRTNIMVASGAKEEAIEETGGNGYFTKYLIEGLQGKANADDNEYIDFGELGEYIKKNVEYASKGTQNPEYHGNEKMIITEVKEQIIENMLKELRQLKNEEKLNYEQYRIYADILEQREEKDTETQQQMREYLFRFYETDKRYDFTDLIALESLSKTLGISELKINTKPETGEPNTPVEEEPEKPEEKTKTEKRTGTNWLTLMAGNKKAEGASIYINGEYEGKLATNGLLIEGLEKGIYTIEIDGEKIKRQSVEIEFETDWMSLKEQIAAEGATRKYMIITNPLMATVDVNGTLQKEKTPVMIEIMIDEDNKLTISKEGYKTKEIELKADQKGEPEELRIELEKNQAPGMPRMTGPGIKDIALNPELSWSCADEEGDSLTFEVWLAEKGQTLKRIDEVQKTQYTLTNLKSDTTYEWKIVAKDNWNRTEGVSWQFETKERVEKTYRIETNPENVTVYINGSYAGTSPLTKTFEEGSYTIEARKDGYQTAKKEITINNYTKNLTRTEQIELMLEEEPGEIKITSSPSGAYIYIEGSYKGTTPKTLTGIKAGYYDIKVKKEGYEEQTEYNVRVAAGSRTTKQITLKEIPKEKEPEILEMVVVEGGSFQMGSTKYSDEKPVHSVTLTTDYWMGKYEITNEEYIKYLNVSGVNSSGSKNGKEHIDMDDEDCEIGYNSGGFYLKKGKAKAPVIEVTWWGAIGYCNWLSEKEGLAVAYNISGDMLDKNGNKTTDIKKVEGYRLPTEAEWEYAARGGNKSKGYTYSGSNSIGDVAWYDGNSGSKTHEVGGKKANELGLYDMSGNVYEWCQDWYDSEYYGKSGSNDPVNLNSASYRVERGGSWYSYAADCRVADRLYYDSDSSSRDLGFRVARTSFF